MNMKRFWVPLLQLLVTSFCLFIYYYYIIIIIIIIIIIVVIIVIVIIIIISCIFFVESTNRLLEEVKFQYQGINVEGGWDIDMHLSLENWLQWIKNS